MRKGRGRTRVSVIIKDIREARSILGSYIEREPYLKDIVCRYVPEETRKPVDSMTFSELILYGRVVKGVAAKEVENAGYKMEKLSIIRDKTSLAKQLDLFK